MFRNLIILLSIAACATKPTPYQKEKKQEGFRDKKQEDLNVVTFRANSVTKIEQAQKYAEFRAIENCRDKEQKHANIIDIVDSTVRKEVTRTSGSGWGPSYGFGMYPYYSRYSSFGVGVNYNTMSTNSWNETITYPFIRVYYTCAEKIYRPQVYLKEISSEQMKLLVKDLKGALQIEKVGEDSPNFKSIEPGDLILKANGKRIEKIRELIRLFSEPDSIVTMQILREGEKMMAKLSAKDVTDAVIKAEKKIISEVCKDKDEKNQKLLKDRKLCN